MKIPADKGQFTHLLVGLLGEIVRQSILPVFPGEHQRVIGALEFLNGIYSGEIRRENLSAAELTAQKFSITDPLRRILFVSKGGDIKEPLPVSKERFAFFEACVACLLESLKEQISYQNVISSLFTILAAEKKLEQMRDRVTLLVIKFILTQFDMFVDVNFYRRNHRVLMDRPPYGGRQILMPSQETAIRAIATDFFRPQAAPLQAGSISAASIGPIEMQDFSDLGFYPINAPTTT